MIKSKISVYARLKPKQNPKGKIITEISESLSVSKKSVSKLTLSNRKTSEKYSAHKEKLKSKFNPAYSFKFEKVFTEEASQEDIFKEIGPPVIDFCLDGYNGTSKLELLINLKFLLMVKRDLEKLTQFQDMKIGKSEG